MLFDAGADVITTGNHVLKRREIYPVLEEENGVIRPANYHPSVPGSGMFILDKLRWQLCVINLQGQMGMEVCANPSSGSISCSRRCAPPISWWISTPR